MVRGGGEFEGILIEDPLLSDTQAALSRGLQELNDLSGLSTVNMVCVYRGSFRNGDIVRVIDALQGVEWYGKITSVEHRSQGNTIKSNLRVVR